MCKWAALIPSRPSGRGNIKKYASQSPPVGGKQWGGLFPNRPQRARCKRGSCFPVAPSGPILIQILIFHINIKPYPPPFGRQKTPDLSDHLKKHAITGLRMYMRCSPRRLRIHYVSQLFCLHRRNTLSFWAAAHQTFSQPEAQSCQRIRNSSQSLARCLFLDVSSQMALPDNLNSTWNDRRLSHTIPDDPKSSPMIPDASRRAQVRPDHSIWPHTSGNDHGRYVRAVAAARDYC